jgi:hypothetical protein
MIVLVPRAVAGGPAADLWSEAAAYAHGMIGCRVRKLGINSPAAQ